MPTPKQTKHCMKRIHFHLYHLQSALNEAHSLDVIDYGGKEYKEAAPCWAMDQVRERIKLTTERACYNAIWSETRPKGGY